MKQLRLVGLLISLGVSTVALARSTQPMAGQGTNPPPKELIDSTQAALVDQIKCQDRPQVARAINAMLAHKLIRYVANENGIYAFAPTVRLTFLGMHIVHISGFDRDGPPFRGVPGTRMVGTAPETFLQIDVAGGQEELRSRALVAGMVEAVPHAHKRGFQVSAKGTYLAPTPVWTSNIECVDYRAY